MSRYYRDPTTGNEIPIAGMRDLQDVKNLMLELCYPIGSMYISTVNVSPATFLGGTWIQHEGYVLRGATSNVTAGTQGQSNDGGADSVSVSSVASHNHTQDSHNHTQDSHNHTQNAHYHNPASSGYNFVVVTSGSRDFSYGGGSLWAGQNSNTANATATNQAKTATNQAKTATNQATGATYSLATLPKYKNVYIWERIA